MKWNERFSLKITMDEGYISHKELWDLSEANIIISLINNFLRLKREYKPKNYRAVNFVATTSHAVFHYKPYFIRKMYKWILDLMMAQILPMHVMY